MPRLNATEANNMARDLISKILPASRAFRGSAQVKDHTPIAMDSTTNLDTVAPFFSDNPWELPTSKGRGPAMTPVPSEDLSLDTKQSKPSTPVTGKPAVPENDTAFETLMLQSMDPKRRSTKFGTSMLQNQRQMLVLMSHNRRGPRTIAGDMETKALAVAKRSEEKPRRVVFGETDYLRDKLGFCMPSVPQTLSTEVPNSSMRGASMGFRHIGSQRLQQMQRLFWERAQNQTPGQFSNQVTFKAPDRPQRYGSVAPRSSRKGNSECKQYAILLDSCSRRTKRISEKANFALAHEIFRVEKKRLHIDLKNEHDAELLQNARNKLEADKEMARQNSAEPSKREHVKIMTRRVSSDSTTTGSTDLIFR